MEANRPGYVPAAMNVICPPNEWQIMRTGRSKRSTSVSRSTAYCEVGYSLPGDQADSPWPRRSGATT